MIQLRIIMSGTGELGWDVMMWQPHIAGRTFDVPVQYFSSDGPTAVHLYPGLGEEEKATECGVRVLAAEGMATTGIVLPFHYLEATPANLERTVVEVPIAIAETLNEQNERPQETPVHLIGNSQGGGVALLTAQHAPERFGALGLIAPVGLTGEYLGHTSLQRSRSFLWRLAVVNSLMPATWFPPDQGRLAATKEVLTRVYRDGVEGRFWSKLNYALGIDLCGELPSLAEKHPLRIFVGEQDRVFSHTELADVLGRAGCGDILEKVTGAHAPLLTRAGRKQLLRAGEWLRSVTPEVGPAS